MGRFDFKSPGAAFTASIADTLAQRKAEERQMMLDQLTVNSDQRAQEAAARQAEEHRLGLEQTRQQMGFAGEDQEFQRAGMIAAGLDPDSEIPAEALPLFQKLGWARQLPTPQVSTETSVQMPEGADPEAFAKQLEQSTAPSGPPRYGYVGNEKQREHRRKQEQTGALLKNLMGNKETAEAGQYLAQLAAANDGIVPEAVAAKFLQPNVPLEIFDQETGKIRSAGNVSPHAQILTHTRPPQQIRPRNMIRVTGPDGTAALVDQESVPVDPRTGMAQLPQGYTISSGGSGGAGGNLNLPLGISDGAYNAYIDELGVLELNEQ
jgi:hypothetical protein